MIDLHPFLLGSESMMMNELIEVSGGLPTENLMKKLLSHKPSNFGSDHNNTTAEDADKDTYIPPNDEAELTGSQIAELALHFPITVTTKPKSHPSMPFLHWLIKCHQLCLLPLLFQQVHWPELLELGLSGEQLSQWDQEALLSPEHWEEIVVDYQLGIPACLEEMLEEIHWELHHLLGETLVVVVAVAVAEEVVAVEGGGICPNKPL